MRIRARLLGARPALGDGDGDLAGGRRALGQQREDVAVGRVLVQRVDARLEVAALAGQAGAQAEEERGRDHAAPLEDVADLRDVRALGDEDGGAVRGGRAVEGLEQRDHEPDRAGDDEQRDDGDDANEPLAPAAGRLRLGRAGPSGRRSRRGLVVVGRVGEERGPAVGELVERDLRGGLRVRLPRDERVVGSERVQRRGVALVRGPRMRLVPGGVVGVVGPVVRVAGVGEVVGVLRPNGRRDVGGVGGPGVGRSARRM